MKETKCEAVRRELEELMLGDECSNGATQHLRGCGACREFQQQQTKLRQIVGSLGMVEAPPDFDFRLRARLANESSRTGFHLRSLHWSFATKGVATAAMVVLFVGGAVYVRTIVNQPVQNDVAIQRQEAPVPAAPRPIETSTRELDGDTPLAANTETSENAPRRVKRERRTAPKPRTPLVAIDRASERPPTVFGSPRQSPMFPIDASLESLKFSLDDGDGNARTISVPTITFGAQRVLPKETKFVPKGDW